MDGESQGRSRFNETDELAYLKRRLQDERNAAEWATDNQSRIVHQRLADNFAQRIATFGLGTASNSDEPEKRDRWSRRQ